MRMVELGGLFAAAVLMLATACGSDNQSSTTQTSAPQPLAPGPATYTLAGVVSASGTGRPVQGGNVMVTSGPNANHGSPTDGNGYYSIAGLAAGSFTVHASASGYNAADKNVSLSSTMRLDIALDAAPPPAPQCDPGLWNHVHDPSRLKVMAACQTVTGVVMKVHDNADGDGDENMLLDVDPPFKNLLNSGNMKSLGGFLQLECVCQAPVKPAIPDAVRACKNFKGTVPIPAVGARVQVTGTYVLDQDHGWMEIHPVSVLTVLP